MNTLIKKTIEFGKVAFYRNGRRNMTEVTIELRETADGPELSICGAIWNQSHTDIVSGGQNLGTMIKYLRTNKAFMRIYRLWLEHHLNGMSAGTRRQNAELAEAGITGRDYDYDRAVEHLKAVGLYTDTLDEDQYLANMGGNFSRDGFKYGHGWVHHRLPAAVIDEVYDLCGVALPAVA